MIEEIQRKLKDTCFRFFILFGLLFLFFEPNIYGQNDRIVSFAGIKIVY